LITNKLLQKNSNLIMSSCSGAQCKTGYQNWQC